VFHAKKRNSFLSKKPLIAEWLFLVERNLSISNLKLTQDLRLVSNFFYFLRAKGLIKNGAKIIETEPSF
jgi:hypothetical protein